MSRPASVPPIPNLAAVMAAIDPAPPAPIPPAPASPAPARAGGVPPSPLARFIARFAERHGFTAEEIISPRYWRTGEVAALRVHYPALGPKGCAAILPGRTPATIKRQAAKLGVRRIFARKEAA